MSCGQVHSQARQFVAAGQPPHLVAETLEISRSSLYYRAQPRSSRADRRDDQRIVEVCGDKPAFGYRRVQFHELVPPEGIEQKVEATLAGVHAGKEGKTEVPAVRCNPTGEIASSQERRHSSRRH
jgi:hypothetical protein